MKRVLRIARFAFAAASSVVVGILFLRGFYPSFLNFHAWTAENRALGRVVERVDFRGVPFNHAMYRLSRAAGVEIDGDASVTATEAYFKNINVYDEQITVRDALSQMIRSEGDAVFVVPEGGRIQIGFAGSAGDEMCVEEFALADFKFGDDFGTDFGLIGGLAGLVGADASGVICGNRLFVIQPASWQRRWHQVLEALDPRAQPAARRSQLPLGTEVIDIVDRSLRPRDSRAASNALGSTIPVVNIPRRPFGEALTSLSAQARISILATGNLYEGSSKVQLEAKNMSLRAALEDLFTQTASGRLGVVPDRDTVWISPEPAPKLFRIYNLQSTSFASCTKAERSSRMSALLAAVPAQRGRSAYMTSGFVGANFVLQANWTQLATFEKLLHAALNGSPDRMSTAKRQ